MTTTQIYSLLNSVNQQAYGTVGLTITDLQGLISLGTTVLSSSTNTEAFLDTLAQRIGKTIIDYRKYNNRLRDLVMDDFEYGAILQKIKIVMPAAEADESYGLVDGNTVDHYKIAKPNVLQKLFVSRTPYQYHVTIQREHLKEAFTSESAMGAFIAGIFGEVQNAIEKGLEDLGRACVNNMMAETTHNITLLTDFIADGGDSTLTAATAMMSKEFLNYAMYKINLTLDKMEDMTTLYNDGTVERFTPKKDQRIMLNSEFVRRAETVSQYAAFHDKFVNVDGAYIKTNFWQDSQSGDEMSINVNRASDGTATKIDYIIGCVYDRDAMGIYKLQEDVLTSPVNAAGMYYNTYWHEKQLWFNDLSEQFAMFTIS